jgi:SAM-dependent methyltransferase
MKVPSLAARPPYDRPLARDVYQHPPRRLRPADAGVTRRSLFGLKPAAPASDESDGEAATAQVLAAWEPGPREELWKALEPVAEVMADLAGIRPGAKVLDVGIADGSPSRPWTVRGAAVTGCDFADAHALGFGDGEFDAVLSAFGAAFAPRPERAAAELCRVIRPGGVVTVAAWSPRGLPGSLHALARDLDPVLARVLSPGEWGRQAVARERLSGLLEDLELRTRTVRLRYPDADAAFAALAVWTALDDAQLPALRPAFERLLASQNNSGAAVEIDARYLIACGRRRMDP